MPESVEAKIIHFFRSSFLGPFFERHAVSRYEHASAIVAESAVHEYFLLWIIAEQQKKLRNLFVTRSSPAAHGNVHETDSQRFGVPAFPFGFVAIFAAQIDNRGDAQLL